MNLFGRSPMNCPGLAAILAAGIAVNPCFAQSFSVKQTVPSVLLKARIQTPFVLRLLQLSPEPPSPDAADPCARGPHTPNSKVRATPTMRPISPAMPPSSS
jgi:hypothetical protein